MVLPRDDRWHKRPTAMHGGFGFICAFVAGRILLVTYFWFIGITNAVNMLDNMDGLSSGVVMLGGTTLVILTMDYREALEVQPLAVLVGLVFVVSLLGFWLHNRPPAAIFMGDSGSLSIGYVLAALAV